VSEFPEFPKIYSPFKRFTDGPQKNRLDRARWYTPELETLKDLNWDFTEKIDGTNIRVHWDGHRVSFGGRTENAQIPALLLDKLDALFKEELFEQQFGEESFTLYGEGVGPKIQSGGAKFPEYNFILFDVLAGRWWLRWGDVCGVAEALGATTAAYVGSETIPWAIACVEDGVSSVYYDGVAEGLVGRVPHGLLDRGGNRILVKIKTKDFSD
jgi:hypothetical protein